MINIQFCQDYHDDIPRHHPSSSLTYDVIVSVATNIIIACKHSLLRKVNEKERKRLLGERKRCKEVVASSSLPSVPVTPCVLAQG